MPTPPGSKDSNGTHASPGAAVSLPGYFSPPIPSYLWQNNRMPRWLNILLALAIGIGLGLLYGWVIDPIQYVDLTPDTLRADYRADYVLMVAEAYQSERDAETAARRLAIFGSQPPAEIAAPALQFGRENGFSQTELILLEDLVQAMQTYQPGAVLP